MVTIYKGPYLLALTLDRDNYFNVQFYFDCLAKLKTLFEAK